MDHSTEARDRPRGETAATPRPWLESFVDGCRIIIAVLVAFALLLPVVGYTATQTAALVATFGAVIVPYWTVVERYFVPRFP